MGQDLVHVFVLWDGSIGEGGHKVSEFQQLRIIMQVKEIHVLYLIVFMGLLSVRFEWIV